MNCLISLINDEERMEDTMDKFTKSFEADTSKILNIVINSLYSDRDIFLRELLSNASDAIQKRRFQGQTTPILLNSEDDQIEIVINKKKKYVEIKDNGIGLNDEELSETLGTIAKSGTAGFLKEIEDNKDSKSAAQSLIGKFGVGFYSAFMVADTVEVTTQKAGTNVAYTWVSDGQTGYDISKAEMDHPIGTSVKLFIKKDAKEYCEGSRIRSLVKKYSDHIQIPIKISEKEGEVEQVNSAQALWTKSPSKISTEEYKEFYNSSFGTFDEPFITIHNKSEGTVEFTNLLFIPTNAPFDLHEPERKSKINLYINRVFITNDLQEIIPTWLRFLKGILDTSSLDLNVSREMVQSSPVLKKISKSLTKRVLSELKKKQKKDPEAYDKFWSQFGKVIKEGLYEDFENRDKIAEIIRVYSNKEDKLVTLQDYIDNFAEGQDQIFYFTGDTLAQAKSSPHLEGFQSKDIDVLLMVDPIDAFWISQMTNFQEKSFVSISRDKYDIEKVGKKKGKTKKNEPKNSDVCIALIKECLEDKIENAIASTTLIDSPVRLVAGEGGLDFNLERILKAQNPDFESSKKVLEINVGHDLIQKLPKLSLDLQKSMCRVLFEQARVQDGEMPSNTQQFSQDIIQLGLKL